MIELDETRHYRWPARRHSRPRALAAASAAAQARKILIIASNQDIPNFDPHIATGYSASMLLRNIYDSLVRVEGNPPKPVPAPCGVVDRLARTARNTSSSSTRPPSSTTARRSPPRTSQYSFDRLLRLDKGNAWMIAGHRRRRTASQPVDAQTVRDQARQAVRRLPAGPALDVDRELEGGRGQQGHRRRPDLSAHQRSPAPARSASRRAEAGNLYEFERVANGWKQGGGNLTGAIWKIIRETSTQRLMLQRGEAHIAGRPHQRGHGRDEGRAGRRARSWSRNTAPSRSR